MTTTSTPDTTSHPMDDDHSQRVIAMRLCTTCDITLRYKRFVCPHCQAHTIAIRATYTGPQYQPKR